VPLVFANQDVQSHHVNAVAIPYHKRIRRFPENLLIPCRAAFPGRSQLLAGHFRPAHALVRAQIAAGIQVTNPESR